MTFLDKIFDSETQRKDFSAQIYNILENKLPKDMYGIQDLLYIVKDIAENNKLAEISKDLLFKSHSERTKYSKYYTNYRLNDNDSTLLIYEYSTEHVKFGVIIGKYSFVYKLHSKLFMYNIEDGAFAGGAIGNKKKKLYDKNENAIAKMIIPGYFSFKNYLSLLNNDDALYAKMNFRDNDEVLFRELSDNISEQSDINKALLLNMGLIFSMNRFF